MRKATVDMRLAKRKAKADHRRAQSDRQLSHLEASTSSSTADFLPSSPQPLKHGSTAATASGSSKRSVKSKATKASLVTTAPSSAPVIGLRSRAQRRATTRSGRNAAWGMEAVAESSNQGGHVVDARLGNVARAEAGLGTAVGGLFKVCSLICPASCACRCDNSCQSACLWLLELLCSAFQCLMLSALTWPKQSFHHLAPALQQVSLSCWHHVCLG